MVITESDYGSVICGVVKDVRQGVGSAKDSLSIITLNDMDLYGNIVQKEEKMLCWNKEHEDSFIPLASKALRMRSGEVLLARVRYDIGDPNKSTCYEMKKQGIFKLRYHGNEKNLLSGRVAKVYHGDKVTGVWIPTYKPNNRGYDTIWYHICFWNTQGNIAKVIGRGDYLIVRCGKMTEKSYNGKYYLEASADKFLRF